MVQRLERTGLLSQWARLERPLLLALLAVSVTANIAMSRVIRAPQGQPNNVLAIGAMAPPLGLETTGGVGRTIDFAAAPEGTVLYALSPECSWCDRNLPNIEALVEQLRGRYEVVLFTTGSGAAIAEYAQQQNFQAPVHIISKNSLQAYQLNGLPQTLVVDRRGMVQKNWLGAYSGSLKREVETFFRVSLPGVKTTITVK